MDIFNLNEKVEGLVSYLQETGYSAMYIGYVKKMAEWLSENANHYKWQSFSDVEPILKELWSNKYTYRNKVRLLRVICQYIENGLLPDGCKHYSKPHHYELLGAEYKDVTDMAFNMVDRRCKFSINVKYALSSFFFRLQEMGGVLIRINNRKCGIGSVFQRRKTENGPFVQIFGGIWAESLFASLWQIR